MLDEAAGLRNPGIVDKDSYSAVIAQARLDCDQVDRVGKVGRQDIDGNAVFLAQAGRERIQSDGLSLGEGAAVGHACQLTASR